MKNRGMEDVENGTEDSQVEDGALQFLGRRFHHFHLAARKKTKNNNNVDRDDADKDGFVNRI